MDKGLSNCRISVSTKASQVSGIRKSGRPNHLPEYAHYLRLWTRGRENLVTDNLGKSSSNADFKSVSMGSGGMDVGEDQIVLFYQHWLSPWCVSNSNVVDSKVKPTEWLSFCWGSGKRLWIWKCDWKTRERDMCMRLTSCSGVLLGSQGQERGSCSFWQ